MIESVKNKIFRTCRILCLPFADSESLAAYIILNRTLAIEQDIAKLAMFELSRRRQDGDLFDFERYIDSKMQEMKPPVMQDFSAVSKFLNQMRGMNNNLKKTIKNR